MNRRDFLRPRHVAETAGQLAGAAEVVAEQLRDLAVGGEFVLTRTGRRAMATQFEILIPFGLPAVLDAAEAAFDLIDRLEDQLTVYRPHSEVSLLNRTAHARPVAVETGLFQLLARCAELHRETDGAFDVAVGALIKAWGFYRRQGQIPGAEELNAARAVSGMKLVALDPHTEAVRLARPGVELNFGSIGKGYALDRAAALLRDDWKMPAALLHGGRSSLYAIGSEPGTRLGWRVAVTHPWQQERTMAFVRLRDQGLGTSAATFQHFETAGRKLGHILDPRRGWPAEGIASATVVAPTAADADALATAFYILGVDAAKAYCEAHPGIGAVLLPDGAATPVVLGFAADDIELAPSTDSPTTS